MLKFENPTNKRYYYISPQRDLLNDNIIIIYRGSPTKRITTSIYVGDNVNSKNELNKIIKRRLSRGYVQV